MASLRMHMASYKLNDSENFDGMDKELIIPPPRIGYQMQYLG